MRDDYYFQLAVDDVIEGKSLAVASRELGVSVLQFRYHFHKELRHRNQDLYKKLLKDKQETYDAPSIQFYYKQVEGTDTWQKTPIQATPECPYEFKEIDLPVIRDFKNDFIRTDKDDTRRKSKEAC